MNRKDEPAVVKIGLTATLLLAVLALAPTSASAEAGCVAAPSGLVSWWPLDETSGTTAADIVDANPGMHFNGPTPVAGKVAGALSFDGVDDFVTVANEANFDFDRTDAFTVEFWVKLQDTPSKDHFLVNKQFGGAQPFNGWHIVGCESCATPDTLRMILRRSTSSQTAVHGSTDIIDGQFHHVAGVNLGNDGSASDIELYVDGQLETVTTVEQDNLGSNSILNNISVSIGSRGNVADNVNMATGVIDEVEIYNRALTAEEIAAIFNAGSAGKCKLTVEIDIKPGSNPNSINPRSKGKIPVAILTTRIADGDSVDFDPFDNTDPVDPTTLEFGPSGATIVHSTGHAEDVDSDGDLDMVLDFKTQLTGIACGDTEATVTGATLGGQTIGGTDAINTVGCP